MPKEKKAPHERTSFGIAFHVLDRLRLARVMTGERMQTIAEAAISKHLDDLGIPRELPKLKGKTTA